MDMIIKLITDRQYGWDYNPIRLYKEAHERERDVYCNNIAVAMELGRETDIRTALCTFVKHIGFGDDLCEFINNQRWLNAAYSLND